MAKYKLEYFSGEVKEIIVPTITSIKTRYDNKIRLRRDDDNLQIRSLHKNDLVASNSGNDIVHTILVTENERPELTSLTYFGDARLYWIILAANGMKDRSEYIEGKVIIIPSVSSVYSSGGVLTK